MKEYPIHCSGCENELTQSDFKQGYCQKCQKEINMTSKEVELLKLASKIIADNSECSAKLTGSLLLAYLGYKKRREATDIDIVCLDLCEAKNEDFYPILPKSFEQVKIEGDKSQVDAIQFKNSEGLKVEFMHSEEKGVMIGGLSCADVNEMLQAKHQYAFRDMSEETSTKHFLDLRFLFGHYPFNVTFKVK